MLTRLRFMILTLLALALSLTVSAQTPTPSALTLAGMTPANAMLYAAIRTDAGFVETLDGLVARITESSTGSAMNNTIGSFLSSEGVRAWIGDSVAIFAVPPVGTDSNQDLFALLVELKDRDEAIAYFTKRSGTEPMTLPNGYVAFRDNGSNIVFTENMLLVGETAVNAVPLLRGESLADSARFQQALMALPSGSDYPLLAYFDPHGAIMAVESDMIEAFGETVDIPALAESVGVFSAGMRQLDAQTYTFDIDWSFGEGSPLAALNLPEIFLPTPPAINPDFLNVIPDTAQLVLQGGGLWSQFEAANRATATLISALRVRMMASDMGINRSNALLLAPTQWGSAFVELMIRGSLDMTSEQLSAALDGDSAFALRFSAIPDERVPKLLVEPGVWFASRDNGAADFLTGGSNLLEDFGATLTEQMGGVGFDLPSILTGEGGGSLALLPTSMVWLATDSVTYIGADALTLENKQTLVAVPRITERIESIRPHLLENATGFAWIDVAGLAPILDETDSTVRMATAPFDSLFISNRQTEDGLTARFAFSLK